MKNLVLWCLVSIPLVAPAGELFRWVDANGKVHYGDAAPADATQVERKKFPGAVQPSADISYETRLAQQNFPVVLYVAESCMEYCDKARALLKERGIPHSVKNLTTQVEVDAFKALSGSSTTPALAVGRTFLRGYQAEQWHGELDIAGYPKSAPLAKASGKVAKPLEKH